MTPDAKNSRPLSLALTYFANRRKALNAIQNKLNLTYTVLIFFNSFAYGISVNLIGATLVDIGFVYSVSLNVVSQLLIANSVGYMIGALSGNLYKWLNRQFMLTFFSSLIALTSLLLPHYGNLWLLFTALTLNGFGGGAWDASHTAWLVDMWPKASGPVLQANQFLYGIGTTTSPLLASRFIFGEAGFTGPGNRTMLTQELRKKYLAIPYAINGVAQFIAPTLFLILFFTNRYKLPSSQTPSLPQPKNSISQLELGLILPPRPKTQAIPNRHLKLALCSLCIAAYFTAETGYFPYCTAMFQYLEIKLTASESAHVTSILSLCYTIGPLITAFISMKIKPDTILLFHYTFILEGVALLYCGRFNLTLIYTGSAILGYGFSAMIPALNSFTQLHFGLNDRVCSIFSFLSGSISLVIPLVLASSFQTHPLILLYMQVVFISISLVIFICIRGWIYLETSGSRR